MGRVIHWTHGHTAHCGASNNRNIGHRAEVTSDRGRVTCKKCRQYIDSGKLEAFEAFMVETAIRLGIGN